MNVNKKLLIPVVLFVLLALGGGSYFFLSKNSTSTSDEQADQGILEEIIPTLAPSEIGLKMVARADNRAVKLILSNSKKVSRIEFDLVYDADQASNFGEDEGGAGKVSRNVTDELAVDGKSPFETKYYDLGSCSSGKCRFDTGVTKVITQMKVTMLDGKIFQVEDSLDL